MPRRNPGPYLVLCTAAVLIAAPAIRGQSANDPVMPPLPQPPPPSAQEETDERDEDDRDTVFYSFVPESDGPWGLASEVLTRLADQARAYRDYAVRFTCRETVRLAEYDSRGEASKEKQRLYEYLLEWDERLALREYRQRMRSGGRVARSTTDKDQTPFPPAYAWAFLFGPFYQNYFEYRELGSHFEGFDLVRVIQFKGSLPWTDGQDIREWEGLAIVDATTLTPLEIRAEPSGQRSRLRAAFDQWSRSFNFMGMRTGPKPIGHRCLVQFGMRENGLSLPTALRYDSYRVIGPKHTRPETASIRQYDEYRFFMTRESTEIAGPR